MPPMSDPTQYGDDRNDHVRTLVEDYHWFLNPLEPFTPRANETLIDTGWSIHCDHAPFDLVAQDFVEGLAKLNVELSGDQTRRITLSHTEGPPTVNVMADAVTLSASSVSDMWRAVVWCEHRMASRHAPILSQGEHKLSQKFDLRITTSMFAHGLENPAEQPDAYTDDHLRTMAHMGYTSLFLYIDLWDFCQSELLPELGCDEAAHNLSQLADLSRRAQQFGLRLVLMVAAPRIEPEHPVFQRCPQLKGGIVMRKSGHALCTSQELTHEFYADQMRRLVEAVPNVAAMAYLIGGEGFLHCYTRAVPRTENVTNCPECGKRKPSEVLPPLLNVVTAAVRDASPETRVMFWPYSSFIWTHQPAETYDWSEDIGVIRQLDKRATWLIEIEKDGLFEFPDVGTASVTDYAIHFIGPSQKLVKESAALKECGVELAVKTETCVDASFAAVPYIPVLQRWVKRQRVIHDTGTPVSWETWRFHGSWQSPSVEAAYWLDVEPALTDEEVLHLIASRIYGREAAEHVVKAWDCFSDSWETFYRQYGTYWSGPLVLGPSHPYDTGQGFFNRNHYHQDFYSVPAGMRESENQAYLDDPRNLWPNYWIFPLRLYNQFMRDIGRVADLYRPGMAHLREAMTHVPESLREHAQFDFDIASMTLHYVDEALDFHRFTRLRDTLTYMSPSDPEKKPLLDDLDALFIRAIERAEDALAIVRRTPFIGWGYTFGVRLNAAMIEDKITKTRGLLAAKRAGKLSL